MVLVILIIFVLCIGCLPLRSSTICHKDNAPEPKEIVKQTDNIKNNQLKKGGN